MPQCVWSATPRTYETLQTACLEVPHLTPRAAVTVRYLLDRVADNNRMYLVDSHIQAAPEIKALLEEPM